MAGYLIDKNEIERLTECCMCLGQLNNAVLLPCQHTICRIPCLDQLLGKKIVSCPKCRAVFTEGQVKPCFFMQSLIDAIQKQPETLCPACELPQPGIDICVHCDREICSYCRLRHMKMLRSEVSMMSEIMLKESGTILEKLSNDLAISLSQNDQMKTEMLQKIEGVKEEMMSQICNAHKRDLEVLDQILENEKLSQMDPEVDDLLRQLNDLEISYGSVKDTCMIDKLADFDWKVGRLRKKFQEKTQAGVFGKSSSLQPNENIEGLEVNSTYKFLAARIKETPMLSTSTTLVPGDTVNIPNI